MKKLGLETLIAGSAALTLSTSCLQIIKAPSSGNSSPDQTGDNVEIIPEGGYSYLYSAANKSDLSDPFPDLTNPTVTQARVRTTLLAEATQLDSTFLSRYRLVPNPKYDDDDGYKAQGGAVFRRHHLSVLK